jgi:excisionase family DNA binding protein
VACAVSSTFDPLLTIRDTAKKLSCSERHVRRLIDKRILAAVRVGTLVRINPRELDALIEKGGAR